MRVNTKVQSKIAAKINIALFVGIICSIVLSGCGKEIDITPLFGQWKNVSEISNSPQTIRIGKYEELVSFMTSTDHFFQIYDENGELCRDSDCTIKPKNEKSGIIILGGGYDRAMYTFKNHNTIVLTGSIEGTFILDNNEP